MERFQKSKETPNEDKIVEEFWLRLDNDSSETNVAAAVVENGTMKVQENGTARAQQNEAVEIPEHGQAILQENGTATIHENGDAPLLGHEAPAVLEDEETAAAAVLEDEEIDAPDNPVVHVNGAAGEQDKATEQNVSDPDVDHESGETGAAHDLANSLSEMTTGTARDEEEKSHAVEETDAAVENES